MKVGVPEVHAVPSDKELLERARSAIPTLAARAEQTERRLRPDPDSIAAVRQAGLFALTVPRHAGGFEASLRGQVGVLAQLGAACTSTAWVTALSGTVKNMFAPVLPEEARSALFADPNAIVCGHTVPVGVSGERTEYGLRISGRWRLAAGCEDASWAVLVVPVFGDGLPGAPRPVLVSVKDLTVERTGRTAGLAGTGSHTLVAHDVVVPLTHVASCSTAADTETASPTDLTALLGTAVALLAALIGAARGAQLTVGTILADDKAARSMARKGLIDSPRVWHWYFNATHLIDTALYRALFVADLLDDLPDGEPLPAQQRAQAQTELISAAQECREAVENLLDLHGTSGFNNDNPLQRFWRDVSVGTRHPHFSPYTTAEDYLDVLLGAQAPLASML
ncbi:acyl-CoA dehydrogenase family protein [Streptomyces sp. NPDC050523]|uniref:acyl-CoA dehydrogenase family protein n=1 Tax=Streptomyces sp. NPDC050523 TaxID=3365622 RepID=UPI0037B4F586